MRPFVSRVTIRNYKSIAACQVDLRELMFLVGPNGSGKSNFLDALRFVADALRSSLDHALRDRGGLKQVRRRSGGPPPRLGLRVEFRLSSSQPDQPGSLGEPQNGHRELPGDAVGFYAFRIRVRGRGGYEVQDEQCVLYEPNRETVRAHFTVHEGQATTSALSTAPAVPPDRLYLVTLS